MTAPSLSRRLLGPPPEGDLPDTAVTLFVGLFAYLVVQTGVFGALAGSELRRVAPGHVDTIATAAVNLVFALALLKPALGGTRRPTVPARRIAAIGVAAGVATFAIAWAFGTLVMLGREQPEQFVVTQARRAQGADLAGLALIAVVVAPFAEEVFFRGVLFPAVAKATRPAVALVVQAAAFGAIHVVAAPSTWPLAIPLAVVGWCCGWIYWRTGSLATPVVLHATFNAINFAVLRLAPAAS